jgi:DNA replication protein DnaC
MKELMLTGLKPLTKLRKGWGKMGKVEYERLKENLERLRLRRILEVLDSHNRLASERELAYTDYLDGLIQEEVSSRTDKSIKIKIQLARLPFIKTIEQFDFSFQPTVDKKKVEELFTLKFIDNCENVIFLGPPGTGKTHLAIALGVRACQQGHRVYFTTLSDMISKLRASLADNSFKETLNNLTSPSVLILDEIGYLPLDREGSNFFFQLVSKRYEKGSIILTSNKTFGEWGTIFADTVIASAILDRLLHQSISFNIKGESYRLKEKKEKFFAKEVKI